MPLSTTGLQEGDFTLLRVLKDGVMQDVLSLVGATDTPSGGLAIEQISGLQSQLDAKATLQALSLASEAIGAELDGVETQVSAVGAAVASLGQAVAAKAQQSELDQTNAALNVAYANINALGQSLNSGYSTLESSLRLKASQAALDFTTASTQTRLDDIRAIQTGMQASIAGTAAAQVYTNQDLAELATSVAAKAPQSGLDALEGSFNSVATSLNSNYNTISSLLGTRASQTSVTAALALKQDVIADGALTVAKIGGLQDTLDRERDIRVVIQQQLGSTAQVVAYNQLGLADLTSVVNLKPSSAEITEVLLTKASVSSLVAGLATKQEKIDSLSSINLTAISCVNVDISGELNAGVIRAFVPSTSNVVVAAQVGSSVSFLQHVHGHHLDSCTRWNNAGRTLYIQYYAEQPVVIGKITLSYA
jgi:hypothetical protein